MMNNIFIAFDSKKVELSLAKMIIAEGYNIAGIARNILDLKRTIDYYRGGILIIGYKFCGMLLDDLIADVPEYISVVLIADSKQLATCDSDRVFKLAVPLQKNDLICSVEMLVNMSADTKIHSIRTLEDERTIDRAKRILIDRYSMSEEQAHYYMQKKSMDTGKKLIDIARIIVNL